MLNELLERMVKEAGFKVFGEKIVAADDNNSGLATDSVKRLVEIVRNTTIDEILKEIDEPMDQFAIWETIKAMRSNEPSLPARAEGEASE